MATRHLDNPSPVLIAPRPPRSSRAAQSSDLGSDSPGSQEGWSSADVFELLRTIVDPEHPHTLEELGVVKEEDIVVTDVSSTRKHSVNVHFTPTVPHCSMATLIGLCIRVRLLREMPSTFKLDVAVAAGTHASEMAINKQLADKERVAAALENPGMMEMVEACLVEPT
uniref:MIP18 family-like domain-containing protein n=1 Tax=Pycnococcus provasolii TaxID=41880 RepID=A0A7S2AZ41_9CHLO